MIVALTRAFPEYGDGGLRSLSASPTIYLTREAHDSFNKIAHMTGIGRHALRAVATTDFMTAEWAPLPHELLAKISNRIINEVRGINRVTYDISSKPPSTIEWE